MRLTQSKHMEDSALYCFHYGRYVTSASLLVVLVALLLLTSLLLVFEYTAQQNAVLTVCCQSTIFHLFPPFGDRSSSAAAMPTSEHINASLPWATSRRLPSALIIGVRKGGTRALLEFLSIHPNIRAKKKEMHFFDLDANYRLGLDWYRQKMPYSSGDQITIEKTPAYFTAEVVPGRVFRMNRTVKLIVVLRDPVARTISDYAQIYSNRVSRGKDYATFDSVVLSRDNSTVNATYRGVSRSLYYEHLMRWLRCFSMSQIHFVNGEKLVSDPLSEVQRVERFLGLPSRLSSDSFFFNATRGFYCLRVDSKQKCLSSSKGRKHPEVSEHVLHALRNFYQPHNQRFYALVGTDFGWS